MLAVTAILSCVIKIRGIFKSTKWRHFENVKFEALSARGEQKGMLKTKNYRSTKQIRDKWKENLPKEMKRRNETLENKP